MSARILVVDDITFNVKLLETKLRREYYEVYTAINGIEAIKKAIELKPDIILMDIMMPEMDGFEATRAIKINPVTTHIPIIMITALNAMEDKVTGLNAGADDFLTKPINDQALMIRLKSLLRLKFMTDELRLRNITSKQLGLTEPAISEIENIKDARILVVNDDLAQLKHITNRLTQENLITDSVFNERDAFELIKNNSYSLFIVSTQLIDSDGLRFCSQLRSVEEFRHIPILIIIEENDEKVLIKALEIGVNDYLISPIELNELLARVKTQLRRKVYHEALLANYIQNLSLSVTDSLTSLYNRRYLDIHLKNLIEKAILGKKNLSLIMIDIDHFKQVNDLYGHLNGDAIIKQIAVILQSNVRPVDLNVRFGGEEFIIILPETNLEIANIISERIRQAIENNKFIITTQSDEIKITVSIGVSTLRIDDTSDVLIDRADKCLYKAKANGRNKVFADDKTI